MEDLAKHPVADASAAHGRASTRRTSYGSQRAVNTATALHRVVRGETCSAVMITAWLILLSGRVGRAAGADRRQARACGATSACGGVSAGAAGRAGAQEWVDTGRARGRGVSGWDAAAAAHGGAGCRRVRAVRAGHPQHRGAARRAVSGRPVTGHRAPAAAWERRSAGDGAHGSQLYDWPPAPWTRLGCPMGGETGCSSAARAPPIPPSRNWNVVWLSPRKCSALPRPHPGRTARAGTTPVR